MSFEQFLAEAPRGGLLALMAVPLLSALLIVAFLAISFRRRNKKTKMKLGIQKSENALPPDESPFVSPADDPPEPEQINLDLNILGKNPERKDATETEQVPEKALPKLRTASTIAPQEETTMEEKQEDLDLAARLDFQSARPEETVKPAPQAEPPKQDVPPTLDEPVELLRLLRDPQSGQLRVEVAGTQYAKLAEVTDKKIGQYILKLTAHLLLFTNGMIVTSAGIKSLGAPKTGDVPQPVVGTAAPFDPPDSTSSSSTPLVSPPSPEVEAKFLASLQATRTPATESPQPQKSGFFGVGGGKPAASDEGMLGLNLAEEINDIVQIRLRYSSLAATTQIEIRSQAAGGIGIVVNGQTFTSPDDIPHPEVKELIKASIKEWERS